MLTFRTGLRGPTCLAVKHAAQQRGAGSRATPSLLCRARKGRKRELEAEEDRVVVEDVEIFNIETGWSVEALRSMGQPGSSLASSISGSSSGSRSSSRGGRGSKGSQGGPVEWEADGWSVQSEFGGSEGSDDDEDGAWGDGVIVIEGDDGFEIVLGDGGEDEEWDEDDEEGDDVGDIWALAASAPPGAPSTNGSSSSSGSAEGKLKRRGPAALADLEPEAPPKALARLPRHKLRELERQQQEADEEASKLTPAARKKAALKGKTHQRLRIISGTAAGKRLLSPQGDETRPMMEMVRGAVFNMLHSLYGCQGTLPEETRWLDLFAGTGAIGIEALSRGCGECHFVELSPWVVSKCLLPNIENCEVEDAAVVHTMRAEDFLARAQKLGRFSGGAFDFISVCPPYPTGKQLVSYEELYDLLEGSPLIHEETIVIVEYPKRLSHLIRPTLGPLTKLRDRRYGRTLLAVYGPGGGDVGSDSEGEED